MRGRKDGNETKKQILDAAILQFSEKGFRNTTIAAICKLAGTNIASVNYHFGDKETLYVESWRQAFLRSHELYPLYGGVSPDAPAEERLRGWMISLLRRHADPACHELDYMHKEMANPTGLLFEAINRTIEPMRHALEGILRELLGEKATTEDIQLCEMSIRSQCMNPVVLGRRLKPPPGHIPPPGPPFPVLDPEEIADHVVRFSLAGLRDVREHIETRKNRRTKSPA